MLSSQQEHHPLAEDLIAFGKQQKGVSQDYKEEWNWDRLLVGDKLFLAVSTLEGRPVVTLKLAPEHGDLLRQTYPDRVLPGYYMNKVHWNTIYLDQELDLSFLKPLVQESYTLILQGFSKKKQRELLGEDPQ